MHNVVSKIWVGLESNLGSRLIVLAVGLSAYIYFYLTYDAVPGNSDAYPLGWMGWFDQGHYYKAAKDFVGGSVNPSEQFYPPLYPFVASLFYPLLGDHLFFIPNLIFLFIYLWLCMGLFSRYVGPRLALFAVLLGLFQNKLLPLQWVIPWTSSLSAVLILTSFCLCERYLRRREDPDWGYRSQLFNSAAFALSVGLLAPTRPGDFLAMGIVVAFYGVAVLWSGFRVGGVERMRAIKIFLLGLVISILPLIIYFIFNLVVFGSIMSGYFDAVKSGGGTSIDFILDRFYGHIINSETLFGEVDADWVAELPLSYFMLSFIPFGVVFGPTIIRLICLTVLAQMLLIYSYADAVPTGQFRYFNVHYVKWFFPLLPIVFFYFLRAALMKKDGMAKRGKISLLGGLLLLLLSQAITPRFEKIVPDEIVIKSKENMMLYFRRPATIDYIDVPGLYGQHGGFPIHAQKVIINGDEELRPLRDFRPTPTDHGMRFLFMRAVNVRSIEIVVDGFDDLSPQKQRGIIGVEVSWGLSLPLLMARPSSPLPGPPTLNSDYHYQFGQNGNASRYLGYGWSHPEPWGIWMNQSKAEVRFFWPNRQTHSLELHIEGQAFVVPKYQSEVVVEILLNNTKIGVMRFVDGNRRLFRFPVPASAFKSDGDYELEFVSGSVLSPVEAGTSNDPRQLSFGLIGFELRCQQCPSRQDK